MNIHHTPQHSDHTTFHTHAASTHDEQHLQPMREHMTLSLTNNTSTPDLQLTQRTNQPTPQLTYSVTPYSLACCCSTLCVVPACVHCYYACTGQACRSGVLVTEVGRECVSVVGAGASDDTGTLRFESLSPTAAAAAASTAAAVSSSSSSSSSSTSPTSTTSTIISPTSIASSSISPSSSSASVAAAASVSLRSVVSCSAADASSEVVALAAARDKHTAAQSSDGYAEEGEVIVSPQLHDYTEHDHSQNDDDHGSQQQHDMHTPPSRSHAFPSYQNQADDHAQPTHASDLHEPLLASS